MRLFGAAKGFNWKYALGEVTLIVVGVTIALAGSSWYEDRIDRLTEAEYVGRLRAAIESDISTFIDFDEILEIKGKTLKSLLTETATSLMSAGAEELMLNLDYSEFQALPATNSATYEELVGTGRLALIRDEILRNELAEYYSGYDKISGIVAKSDGNYRAQMRGSLPGIATYEWRGKGRPIDPVELRKGVETMLSQPRIQAAINSELYYTADLMFWLQVYRDQAEAILKVIDTKT